MLISRKHVRKVDRYVHPALANQYVRVVAKQDGRSERLLNRAGIPEGLAEGETYLPPAVGRSTRFNAEGRWVIRRDEPKERRYITTLTTRRSEFRGRDHREEVEATVDIHRMCYPRDLILPPAEEVFGFPVDGHVLAATESVSLPAETDKLKHQVNVMLELFGDCEIVRADGTSASPAKTQRHWAFLPSGPYKKGDLSGELNRIFSSIKPGDRLILEDRQDFLMGLDPSEIAQGIGGFNDYLAYVFPQHGRVVLESLRRDNAIYIFKGAWERFSQLSKREILDKSYQDKRIVHATGWKERLQTALKE